MRETLYDGSESSHAHYKVLEANQTEFAVFEKIISTTFFLSHCIAFFKSENLQEVTFLRSVEFV